MAFRVVVEDSSRYDRLECGLGGGGVGVSTWTRRMSAPASARARATACPIPLVPPVIRAVWPSRENMS